MKPKTFKDPIVLPKELHPTIVSLIFLAHDVEVVDAFEEENFSAWDVTGTDKGKYDAMRALIHNYCNNFKNQDDD